VVVVAVRWEEEHDKGEFGGRNAADGFATRRRAAATDVFFVRLLFFIVAICDDDTAADNCFANAIAIPLLALSSWIDIFMDLFYVILHIGLFLVNLSVQFSISSTAAKKSIRRE
jgi:hypothetical protein